jgi:hypothetical protein
MTDHRPGAEGARLPLIRATPLLSEESTAIDIRKLIPAWLISGAIHVSLLSLLLVFTITSSPRAAVGSDWSVDGSVDDDPDSRLADLTDDTIGIEPGLPAGINLDRIDELNVPAPVDFHQPIGVPGNINPVPMDLPPAFGSGQGDGGSIDDPARPGKGKMTPGSPGGWIARPLGFAPGGTDGRSGAAKDKLLREFGGNPRSEAAVAAGLRWLIRHQALDGHWGMHDFHVHGKCTCSSPGNTHDVAGTGMALMALLGAGQTHQVTSASSIYAKNVERALRWLLLRQAADGAFSVNGYEHAIATIAVCEAYGMTADPVLKGPAQRAINCCVAWQHTAGGFRYAPRTPGDLSVTGWFVQALKSGYLSGLRVPNSTWTQVNHYLDTVSTPDGAGYGYQQTSSAPAMTAVGLLSRQYLGWGPRNAAIQKGSTYLQKLPPSPNFHHIYYYYYATQVMYHMAPSNPEGWQQWNTRMRDLLIETQDQGLNPDRRDQKGSWSPDGDCWGRQLGRLGHTCLALLTLEVYYRHLPLYRREIGDIKDEAVRE